MDFPRVRPSEGAEKNLMVTGVTGSGGVREGGVLPSLDVQGGPYEKG